MECTRAHTTLSYPAASNPFAISLILSGIATQVTGRGLSADLGFSGPPVLMLERMYQNGSTTLCGQLDGDAAVMGAQVLGPRCAAIYATTLEWGPL